MIFHTKRLTCEALFHLEAGTLLGLAVGAAWLVVHGVRKAVDGL